MMFLKVSRVKGFEYLRIVRSYRDHLGNVRHKTIVNLGRADKLRDMLPAFEKLFSLYADNVFTPIDKINTNGASIKNYSYIIIKNIWNKYRLDQFFYKIISKKRIAFDFIKVVFSLVINRLLLSELSKLGYFNTKDIFLYLNEELSLQDLYKSLDILAECKEELEEYLFYRNIKMFNKEVKVAFFDVTTLYFESKKEDELKRFGLSKDYKMNEVQIVLSLLIDDEGFPISFDIYEGNKSETKTLLDTLDRLKDKYRLEKITLIADRGISSSLNLQEIKKRGYEYIVGYKIKNSKLSDKILDRNDYTLISFSEQDGYYGYKEFEIKENRKIRTQDGYESIELNHKIVATYSDKRALRDKKERDRAINKINKKIERNALKGKERYLEKYCEEGKVKYRLDLNKIEQAKKYDGFYALACSDISLSALEVIRIHKQIYDVENAFRELKTDLNIRPIYHYTPKRIKGHIIVSFLSYFLLKAIERRLKYNQKTQGLPITTRRIIKSLKNINAIETDISGKRYYLKAKYDPLASKMFEILKIKTLKNIVSEQEIKDYLSMSQKTM